MSYLYDPMNRRRPNQGVRSPTRPQQLPTLEDFNKLAQAYAELQASFETQAKALEAKISEAAIKEDALRRQGEDLKQTEVELLWAKAALEQAQRERDESKEQSWQERYVGLQAEVEALRRRWEQRFVDETNEARRAILRDMLPLADHLELALQHAESMDAEAMESFLGNIKTTLRAFLDTLRRYGVERQEALGKPFDPAMHEAVGQVASETPGEHIAQVVQSGYMDGDKLLRPARVIVSMGNGE